MPQVFPQNHDPDGESSVTGLVHSVESCGTVDGPGIRFVLFLSGCSLRCRYCHNPDTSYVRRGRLRSAGDVLREIARYRDFLQAAGGGVTLSGGDPLFQPDFTGAVLKGCPSKKGSLSAYLWLMVYSSNSQRTRTAGLFTLHCAIFS